MARAKEPHCASCHTKRCHSDAKDCFDAAHDHLPLYEDERIERLHRAGSAIEARHYCEATRLEEIILFAQEMGFRKLGLAFCIGLADEAEVIEEILSRTFEVVSVCCKVSGIVKPLLGLEQIRPANEQEVMCNPAGQAEMLNRAGTELNIICGLCVGHDAVFSLVSHAPLTTLIAKDRVLAHNPIGAIYCQYIRRRFFGETEQSDDETSSDS
ncbi:MAG: DUF1847 domain-containing protein [Phycisphaerales bacterium]|nr:DUF1847 domain-containing protein [Phycisphaerales bacterium]